MVVKIRLACLGKRNNPLFKLTVANSTAKRDGKRLDTLGMYDPKPDSLGAKHITINFDRAKYWLALGAQPSPTVARLFGKAGILPSVPRGRLFPMNSDENNSSNSAESPNRISNSN